MTLSSCKNKLRLSQSLCHLRVKSIKRPPLLKTRVSTAYSRCQISTNIRKYFTQRTTLARSRFFAAFRTVDSFSQRWPSLPRQRKNGCLSANIVIWHSLCSRGTLAAADTCLLLQFCRMWFLGIATMYALLAFGKGRARRFFVNAYNESDSRCCRLLDADHLNPRQFLKFQQPLDLRIIIPASVCYYLPEV